MSLREAPVKSARRGGREEAQRRELSGSKTPKKRKGIHKLNLRTVRADRLVADPGGPEELPTLKRVRRFR